MSRNNNSETTTRPHNDLAAFHWKDKPSIFTNDRLYADNKANNRTPSAEDLIKLALSPNGLIEPNADIKTKLV